MRCRPVQLQMSRPVELSDQRAASEPRGDNELEVQDAALQSSFAFVSCL